MAIRLSADLCAEAGLQAGDKIAVLEGIDADLGYLAIERTDDAGIRPLTLRHNARGTAVKLECRLASWVRREIVPAQTATIVTIGPGRIVVAVPDDLKKPDLNNE